MSILNLKGTSNQKYTFVYGEDYEVNIPEGYKLIKDVEPSDVEVNYGSEMTVEFYVSKDGNGELVTDKEDSSKTNGVNTGVATALSASVAGLAASGIGIVGLLRKKRNKK